MESKTIRRTSVALLCASVAFSAGAADLTYTWHTVANNGDLIPGTDKTFNSYNQPAVNKHGLVVFRARSRGGQGEPEHGIYVRNMDELGPITTVFTRGEAVPQPNNALYNGQLAQFNEFPSVPRIDAGSNTIATRAQSQPVWSYTMNGTDTRTGTAGVYTNPQGMRTTGASMVGDVPGFGHFQVPIPDLPTGTGFDQFPGSPTVTERNTIVFKGNFSAGGAGGTGVFYRNVVANGGVAPIELIASSFTDIPRRKGAQGAAVKFGSTAPPSAAGKYVVFAGYDNEAQPTAGGIYRARLGTKPIVIEKVVAHRRSRARRKEPDVQSLWRSGLAVVERPHAALLGQLGIVNAHRDTDLPVGGQQGRPRLLQVADRRRARRSRCPRTRASSCATCNSARPR